MIYINYFYDPDVAWFLASGTYFQWILIGMFLIVFPMFILGFGGSMMGMTGVSKRTGLEDIPSLVVDNSGDPELFVDMTQGNTSQMFGSIQHDPWQSGGLGTPTHHRMQAGAIHKADGKILYADEFKNFLFNEQMVIEFLTPLENGSYPIRGRSWSSSEGNASLAGETVIPIDCAFFLMNACRVNSPTSCSMRPRRRSCCSFGSTCDSRTATA